jgi:hypothetical protein
VSYIGLFEPLLDSPGACREQLPSQNSEPPLPFASGVVAAICPSAI